MKPKEDYYKEKSEFYEINIYWKSVNSFNKEDVFDAFCEFSRIYGDLIENINNKDSSNRGYFEYVKTERVKKVIELIDDIQHCITVQQVIIVIYYSLNISFIIYLYNHIKKENIGTEKSIL